MPARHGSLHFYIIDSSSDGSLTQKCGHQLTESGHVYFMGAAKAVKLVLGVCSLPLPPWLPARLPADLHASECLSRTGAWQASGNSSSCQLPQPACYGGRRCNPLVVMVWPSHSGNW